jgi:SAM-dependent methyltransferase
VASIETIAELVRALDAGWLGAPGRVLDLGCGLGSELAFLACRGFRGVGVDLSPVALARAVARHPAVRFVRADALHLPFAAGVFDLAIDRGCFHYLLTPDRPAYAAEAARVLAPGGRLFLRACLNTAGVRNDIDEAALRKDFAGWRWRRVTYANLESDTRVMPALVALLRRP